MNSNEKKNTTLKKIIRISIIIFIGLSIYLFISTVVLIFLTKPDKETVVPYIVGKQFMSVYNSLLRKGLTPEIKFHDVYDIDNGIILNQHPDAGDIIPEGGKLNLVVSRSKVYVTVPDLTGLKLPFAINKLKNLHSNNRTLSLAVGTISYIPSDKIKESIVIDHSPGADEEITPEIKVNLLVSAGETEQDMKMPPLKGQSIDLCFDLLLAKGLKISEDIEITDRRWKTGIIQSQKPGPYEDISKGNTVKLEVNYYPGKEHPFTSYERVTYTIPADQEAGLYEAYIEDNNPGRIRFSRYMKPEWKIDFIFKRKGNARITIMRNKEEIETIGIEVSEFD